VSVPARINGARWWPSSVTLAVATAALGVALLVPQTFSDPNGVDPYVVRLSASSLLLLAATFAFRRLKQGRAVLIALAAVTASFTLFDATPQILFDAFGSGAGSGAEQILWASLAQLVVTGLLMLVALRCVTPERRPLLRLTSLRPAALGVAVIGIASLALVALALPASLLGRYGIAPVAVARDLPWLGPACAMQALAQELQFRGLLMGALERIMSRGWANAAQAIFFGLTHLAVNYQGPVAPFIPVTIAVGLALGWIVQRTNSLWTAVIIHAVADILITVAVLPGLYGF
jgi:membrane protease YdiL (CAAX protease family)